MRISESDGKATQCGPGDDTFWTMCPYCYYVYEYSRVYEDCCLRCQNESCRRGFHAAAIPTPPPPSVVSNGRYLCLGFYPVENGFSTWTPFQPMKSWNGPNEDGHVEISDDSDYDEENGDKFETEEVKKGNEIHENVTKMPAMKRKKSVARNSKKISGRGTRIEKDDAIPGNVLASELDLDSGSGSSNLDEDFGSGIGSELGTVRVQFFEGEDDIYVALQDGF